MSGRASLKIGILLGDDIGPEVVPECVKVMQAAAAQERLEITWRPLPIGKRGHEEHGHTLPSVTEQGLRELHGWIMGPIGHAAYPRGDSTWVMPLVRKRFDLFAATKTTYVTAGMGVYRGSPMIAANSITFRLRSSAFPAKSRSCRSASDRMVFRTWSEC